MSRCTLLCLMHVYLVEFIKHKKLETWQGKCWGQNLREEIEEGTYVHCNSWLVHSHELQQKGTWIIYVYTPNREQLAMHFQLPNILKTNIFPFWKGSGKTTGREPTNRWSFSVLLSFHPYSLGCQTDKRTAASQKLLASHAHYLLSLASELKTLLQLHRNNLVLQSLQLTIIPKLFKRWGFWQPLWAEQFL